MHRTRVAATLSHFKPLLAGALRLSFICSFAVSVAASAGVKPQDLPSLPGADIPPPWHWAVDEESATLAYETRSEKWEASLDHSSGLGPSLAVDYGVLLTNRLGAGTTFTRDTDYAEIVANAVYAHRRNVRFRLSGAQLRTVGSGFLSSYDEAPGFRQNSFLLSARKYWPENRYLSGLGLALYRVDATPSAPAMLPLEMNELDEDRPASVASGKLDGFMLNLGLRPTWQSRIELRREFSHIDYRPYPGSLRREFLSSGRVSFQQYFGNCLQLHGGYSAGSDAGRLDLGLAKDNWSLRLSQDFHDADQDTLLQFSISIPLGGKVEESGTCLAQREAAPSFAPIVDAALQRPLQFPREPLIATEQ
ncbi:hypothetical protein [Noviherbaspirillum sp.]|uniref:hypothetical protein n=1 Tax=Noviherbaspirillum sp. TaxID=1926288 RepID=UPI002D66B5B8|nr:hypothetical protein [Noviherbaspirillum sp.]HZW20336.1 hypothetical protein [Noviherbaspirillum sp.]